jgi:opacity protein-like surface antigen
VNISVDAGYDWRIGNVVLGLGGELSITPFKCETSATDIENVFLGGPTATTVRVTTESSITMKAAASFKGRLGFALTDKLMAYGVGGVAVGFTEETFTVNNSLASTNAIYRGSRNKTRVGYVFGAGAEYRITDFISASLEYNRYDFGTASFTIDASTRGGAAATAESATAKTRITGDVFKAGINLRF